MHTAWWTVMPPDLMAFLRGEIDEFHHADHLRMAFEILRRHDFLDAAKSYSSALKQIAARGQACRLSYDHHGRLSRSGGRAHG